MENTLFLCRSNRDRQQLLLRRRRDAPTVKRGDSGKNNNNNNNSESPARGRRCCADWGPPSPDPVDPRSREDLLRTGTDIAGPRTVLPEPRPRQSASRGIHFAYSFPIIHFYHNTIMHYVRIRS